MRKGFETCFIRILITFLVDLFLFCSFIARKRTMNDEKSDKYLVVVRKRLNKIPGLKQHKPHNMRWIYIYRHNTVVHENIHTTVCTPGGQLKPETEQCNDESLMSSTCLNYKKITFI